MIQYLDPTYLRYIHDGLQSGAVHKDNATSLPDGLVGMYEESLLPETNVNDRKRFLEFFGVWALLKKEVSAEFVSMILEWEEKEVIAHINRFTKWFNSPKSGKYVLYHERFRNYILLKITIHQFKKINDSIIHVAQDSIRRKAADEIECYSLENLSFHLTSSALENDQNDAKLLIELINNKNIWDRQIEMSSAFIWTENMLNNGMLYASKYDKEKVLLISIKRIELKKYKYSIINSMVDDVSNKRYELFISRLKKYDFSHIGEDKTFMFFINIISLLKKQFNEEEIDYDFILEVNNEFIDKIYPLGTLDWSDLNLNELVLEVCLFYSSIGLDYSFLIERSIDPMLGISKNFIIDCDLNELIILHKIFTTKPESEWLPIQIKVYQNIVLCLFEIISEDEIDSIIDGIYSEKIKIELIIFLLEEIDDLGKNVKLKKHLISSGELIKKESYYLGVNPNNMIVISARIICLFEKFHLNEEKYSFNTFLGNQIFYRNDNLLYKLFTDFFDKNRVMNDEIYLWFRNQLNEISDNDLKLKRNSLVEPLLELLQIYVYKHSEAINTLVRIILDRIFSIQDIRSRDIVFLSIITYVNKKDKILLPLDFLISKINGSILQSPETLFAAYIYLIKFSNNSSIDEYYLSAKSCLNNFKDDVIKEIKRVNLGESMLLKEEFLLAENLINDFEEKIAQNSFLGKLFNLYSKLGFQDKSIKLLVKIFDFDIIYLPLPYNTDNTLSYTKFNLNVEIFNTALIYGNYDLADRIFSKYQDFSSNKKSEFDIIYAHKLINLFYTNKHSFYVEIKNLDELLLCYVVDSLIENNNFHTLSQHDILILLESFKSNLSKISRTQKVIRKLMECNDFNIIDKLIISSSVKLSGYQLILLAKKFSGNKEIYKIEKILLNCDASIWTKMVSHLFEILQIEIGSEKEIQKITVDFLSQINDDYDFILFYVYLNNFIPKDYFTIEFSLEIHENLENLINSLSKDYFETPNIYQLMCDLKDLELFDYAEKIMKIHLSIEEQDDFYAEFAFIDYLKTKKINVFGYISKIKLDYYVRKLYIRVGEHFIHNNTIENLFLKFDKKYLNYIFQGLVKSLSLKMCTQSYVVSILPILHNENHIDFILQKYYLNKLCQNETAYNQVEILFQKNFNLYELDNLFN